METETTRASKATKKLAKTVSKKVIEELDEQGLGLSSLDEHFEVESETDEGDFDVFIEPAQEVIAKQGSPRFRIKKDGQFLVTVNHPYSWDRLQQEHGGGFYSVTCINQKGQAVKTQSQTVAEPQEPKEEEDPTGFGFSQASGSGGSNSMSEFMKFATFLKMFMGDKEAKTQAATIAQATAGTESTKVIFQMMQENSKNSQQMFLEMMKMNQETAKAISENTTKMIQSMNDKFEKIVSKKDDGVSVHQYHKELRDAEDRGYDKAMKITELIEKKADERAVEKAELMSAEEGDGSLMSSLAKNILPIISKGLEAQSEAAKAAQTQHQARQILNPPPQQLRPLPPQFVPGQQPPPQQQQQPARRQAPTPEQQAALKRRKQEYVLSKVLEPIAEGLGSEKEPFEVASTCLKILGQDKITAKDVVDIFSSQDIIEIARQIGLPVEADKWLSDFYNVIEGEALSAPRKAKPTSKPTKTESVKKPEVVNPELVTQPVVQTATAEKEVNAPLQVVPNPNDAKTPDSVGPAIS